MLAERARTALAGSLGFAGVLWAVYLLTLAFSPVVLPLLGILPRHLEGLDGVVFAPLLHAGVSHLLGNTLPLIVFSFLVLLEGVRRFAAVLAFSWLASGLGVWLFGSGLTVGVSGVVFGLFAYLMVRGFYNRSLGQILLSAVLFLIYGSILWGLFPTTLGVSWQAHLFGAAGGVLAAVVLRSGRQAQTQKRALP